MGWPKGKPSSKKLDISGQRFGRLVAISRTISKNNSRWICRCDCGKETVVTLCHLRAGHTTSCGCRLNEIMGNIGSLRHTHGHTTNRSFSPTYSSWTAMMARCTNPRNSSYERYGARGINVSEELSTFEGFLAVLGERPLGASLGRIDNDLGYFPGNVQWEGSVQNARNKSTTRWIEIDGEVKSAAEWCEIYSIPWGRVKHRLSHGYSPKDAYTLPRMNKQYSRSKT